jgi:hypothetical protein
MFETTNQPSKMTEGYLLAIKHSDGKHQSTDDF